MCLFFSAQSQQTTVTSCGTFPLPQEAVNMFHAALEEGDEVDQNADKAGLFGWEPGNKAFRHGRDRWISIHRHTVGMYHDVSHCCI